MTPPCLTGRGGSQELWRSLHYFNLYRLVVGGVFVASFVLLGPVLTYGTEWPGLFFTVGLVYVLLTSLFVVGVSLRWPAFDVQLTAHVLTDVACMTLLMHASGGMRSGLGVLLLVTLVAAGLIGRGRLVLFYAALATIAILLEQTWRVVQDDANSVGFVQSAFLSLAFFAVAWLSHTLARRVSSTEREAQKITIDLENMAQVNQRIIQDLQDAVLVLDEQGLVRQWNEEAIRLLGRPRQRMPVQTAFPDLARWYRAWWQAPHGRFTVLSTPEGAEVRVRARPVGEPQQPHGAVVFLEDMERVRAEARQYKLAALGRLTGNIAHEIRNPLSSINHAAELLEEDEGLDATSRRLLAIIRTNTGRLEKMVADVLEINRRDRARAETIALDTFLADMVMEFTEVERIDPPGVSLGIAGSGITISFDPVHLNQVLWNLLRNAWRHGRRQTGSVRLSAGVEPGQNRPVFIEVADDGDGVPGELLNQLFEPFFTTASQGTGLGLYVARELCEVNDARLEYRGGAGNGGVFRIHAMGGKGT